IASGDADTGISLMRMEEGLDTGPVLSSIRTSIGREETTGQLTERLANVGGSLLREALPKYLRGELTGRVQDEKLATLAPLLKKENGHIDWNRGADAVHNHIRAMEPWPGAFTTLKGQRVKIHSACLEALRAVEFAPGTLLFASDNKIHV